MAPIVMQNVQTERFQTHLAGNTIKPQRINRHLIIGWGQKDLRGHQNQNRTNKKKKKIGGREEKTEDKLPEQSGSWFVSYVGSLCVWFLSLCLMCMCASVLGVGGAVTASC